VAHFGPQSLAHFEPESLAHFGRNTHRTWEKREHATEHLIYPSNISESIAIDEVTLSKGELYTYITAKDKKQRNGTLIGSIQGTKAEDIIRFGMQIPHLDRIKVKEVSLDMAPNMKLAVETLFPNAKLVTDRFHVVKLVLEALQHIRINYRWEAIEDENKQIAKCKKDKVKFEPQ
jgi:transposase